MNRRTRIVSGVLATATLVVGGAVAATAVSESAGEAPEVSFPTEIVVGQETPVDEATLSTEKKIEEALTQPAPSSDNGRLATAIEAVGLDQHRLIEIRDDKDAGEQPREDALIRFPDGSIVEVWWQGIDSAWALDFDDIAALPEGKPLELGDGLAGQINDRGRFIQATITDGKILVSVLAAVAPAQQGGTEDAPLSPSEVEDLVLGIYESIRETSDTPGS